jgi:hypothetical protein
VNAQIEWQVNDIADRDAQDFLICLFTEMYWNSIRAEGIAILTRVLVPGLVHRCWNGWTPNEYPTFYNQEPDLTFESRASQFPYTRKIMYLDASIIKVLNTEWTAAVASGQAAYTAQITPLLLTATPLPNVLVQLTTSYIC